MVNRDGGTRDERFRSLYQKHYRRMVRYFVTAFRVTEQDANDLAQDAFVRFYEAMDDYRGDAEWGFLQTIATRVALNRIRSFKTRKRNAPTVDIDGPDLRMPPAVTPDHAARLQLAERIRQLHDAIAELPARQRQCIQLQLDGFRYDAIAVALRVSVDAVKSAIRDAKKTLRAKLGDDSALPEDEQ